MRIPNGSASSLSVVATYRFRPAFAAAASIRTPLVVLVIWAMAASVAESTWLVLGLGILVSAGMFALGFSRVRRRSLTADDDGLVVQRDAYRLAVPWSAVTGVERRRHQVFQVDELVVTEASVLALDHADRRTKVVPDEVGDHPATKRVMVSAYDADWRDGPIGDRLRAAGVL